MRKPAQVFWAMALVIVIAGIAGKYYGVKHLAEVRSLFARLHKAPVAAVIPAAPTPGELHMQLIQKMYHATTLMYFPTEDGGEKMACTATAFQEVNDLQTGKQAGYLFISASHCVDGKDTVDLTRDEWPDGGKKVYYHAKIIAQSDRTTGVDASVMLVLTTDHFDTIPLGHNPTQIGEPILNLSGPQGAPKQVFPGVISSLYLNRPIKLDDDGSNWEGFLLAQVFGEGPGSSGSMIVCENQAAACGLTTGHGPGMTVFCPMDRIVAWWNAVMMGKIPNRPAPRPKEEGDKLDHPVGKPIAPPKAPPAIGKPLI